MGVTWASGQRKKEGLLALGLAMPMHGFRAGYPLRPATRAGHLPPLGRAPALVVAMLVA
jgi:hypothetical protein